MNQHERLITTLQGLVSEGGLAEGIALSVSAQVERLTRDPSVTDSLFQIADNFAVANIAESTTTILESGGDITTIAAVLANSYRSGVELGLAVGVDACPDRDESSRLE